MRADYYCLDELSHWVFPGEPLLPRLQLSVDEKERKEKIQIHMCDHFRFAEPWKQNVNNPALPLPLLVGSNLLISFNKPLKANDVNGTFCWSYGCCLFELRFLSTFCQVMQSVHRELKFSETYSFYHNHWNSVTEYGSALSGCGFLKESPELGDYLWSQWHTIHREALPRKLIRHKKLNVFRHFCADYVIGHRFSLQLMLFVV